ncbi:competence protein ComK [Jeotgalibacillus proteolyticus]|uniref:Competence protein ComK n=1 Tax=Jeotgalibacillus proteolyticus TaxID=2082395 RepID=A0A2S5GHJ7_9BACL|nr:competence protein ComK [Jeotgalibacillus proteolyticus]PPA72381.1 competence protein ComK [Jeotgalibacillus proteolyticus]
MENAAHMYSSETNAPYIVSSQTMLLEPYMDGHVKKTKIYEKDVSPFVAEHSPQEIIQYSCLYFLSSYEGRKFSTKTLTNIRHKPPIVIDPVTGVYFFSTHSDTNPHNRWLSLQHLRGYESFEKDQTLVTLSGNIEIVLPLSKQSFIQQYLKASHLFCRTQFNFDEIREKTEPAYTVERQANRLMFLEYLSRIEREQK